MAEIRIRNTNERIAGDDKVLEFLNKHEVVYEKWDASKLAPELQDNFTLTDEQKQAVLDTYEAEIKDLSARRGYRTWDVITLSESTPDLEAKLAKFEEIHTHTEDEIRAIVSGNGIFIIKSPEHGYFDVELEPGDVISVPENTPHFFTLVENRKIVAVRLFVETDGWIAVPFEDNSFQKA
ncbi:cupin domain-containing protein [Paenibacillus sp. PsM32]|uniref:Acireductone dioxygenase n=1 Tax=Paenibacillus kyungheensis TaxID=1452732 RepID=A0AAX3LW37_9BACL|nr:MULTISPECIES: cupin domain-containing protein [Paenibacillus]MDN4617780.1 cupin domain-containing protein [Paenibacillus sp. PsM32]MDQ1234510.1 1,2-dihydroxy-3-keto-5-methylthiopentene dioxygenase [Paenibacillus sp. SORGH_AS_0306]MDR6111557.1 1,2-dihydroxy-3-keto-5-methylthiopentene dioxygenase [Paenibacillus sp. SORGH_AS_0338]WCT54110.1 cupin domain-containing protein [Paenibacillus kyungheensis]WDF52757.1 cupin domain-containing protein [Paenibacillus sp. KACC 21273]